MRKRGWKETTHGVLLGSRLLLLAVVMFSVLVHISAAQCVPPPYLNGASTFSLSTEPALQCEIVDSWDGFMPIAIIAVLISFMLAAFIFMIGVATKQDNIRNFGQGELYEAVATALIIGFFYLIAGLTLQTLPAYLLGVISSSSGGAPATITDPYVVATSSISNTVNVIEYEYDCILNGNDQPNPPVGAGGQVFKPCTIGTLSNDGANGGSGFNFAYLNDVLQQRVSIQQFQGGETLSVSNYLTTFIVVAELTYYVNYLYPEISIAYFLIDGLYVLWGIYYILIFFSFVSPIFVVIGIIFRALLPLRPLGGILIAVGIGFYIVAPVLISFLYSPNINPYQSVVIYSTACSISTGLGGPPYCGLFGSVLAVMNGLWLQVVFFPVLVVAITYTFITQFAAFIGASPQSFSRMRAGFI